jgi:acyl dehydratase
MIPDSLKAFIGKIDPPHLREVEKGAIRRYADAVGDDNPLYYDEEYAKGTRYGGMIAPPGFFGWPKKPVNPTEGLGGMMQAMIEAGYAGILDGGMSYDFFLPVRAGDTLIASPKVQSITEREGKTKMVIGIFETTYYNQNGDLVFKSYQTLIGRQL